MCCGAGTATLRLAPPPTAAERHAASVTIQRHYRARAALQRGVRTVVAIQRVARLQQRAARLSQRASHAVASVGHYRRLIPSRLPRLPFTESKLCTRSRRPRGERLADRHRQASRHTCSCPRASMAGRGRILRGPFTRSCALLSLHVRPGPPYCTYGLRVLASCVLYVPEAQGSLPRGAQERTVLARIQPQLLFIPSYSSRTVPLHH